MRSRLSRLTTLVAAGAFALLGSLGTAAAKEKITFAYVIDPSMELTLYGIKSGKVSSPTVEVEPVALDLPALLQVTATKRYDLVQAAAISLPRLAQRGLDIKIAGVSLRLIGGDGGNIWVKKDSPLKDIQELKGKKLGSFALNSTGITIMRIALWKHYGFNVALEGGDIKFNEMASANIAPALLTGQVDAGVLALSNNYKASRNPEFRPLAKMYQTYKGVFDGDPVSTVIIGYPERMDKKPEAYKEALRLLRASRDYALENAKEVNPILAKQEQIDEDFFVYLFREAIDVPIYLQDSDIKALTKLYDYSKQIGVIENTIPVEQAVWSQAPRQ